MKQSYDLNFEKPSMDTIKRRLEKARTFMSDNKLDVLLVRGTDDYLNEYVPTLSSQRVYLSGFTGSVGDLLITKEKAYLFVDGRYFVQADREVYSELYNIMHLPFGQDMEEFLIETLQNILREQFGGSAVVGFEPKKLSVGQYDNLEKNIVKDKTSLQEVEFNFLEWEIKKSDGSTLQLLDKRLTGKTTDEKLQFCRSKMAEADIDLCVICKLDDIAYLTNMRGYDIDYGSAFKSTVIVTKDDCFVFMDASVIRTDIQNSLKGTCTFFLVSDLDKELTNIANIFGKKEISIGYDNNTTTYWTYSKLKSTFSKAKLKIFDSPMGEIKVIKTPEEIEHFRSAFKRADVVMDSVIEWVNNEIKNGKPVSEKMVRDKVEEMFDKSGAEALSFSIIAAVGDNSAVIHYSIPDPDRIINPGELFLIDTGAYYEGGLSTDLTRTFLVGGDSVTPSEKQKEIYTYTLKGAIQGLKARIPVGCKGIQLDTIVRNEVWKGGYDYKHGTGHGIGVFVHEAPPGVNIRSTVALQENMIFSIEPGIYLEGFGGVRIENIVTLRRDENDDEWMKVVPLTFAKLDDNLINQDLLSEEEIDWLDRYKNKKL